MGIDNVHFPGAVPASLTDAQTEQLARLLIEAPTEHAIFMLDPDGRIASWSGSAEALTGFATECVLGRPSSYLYLPEDARTGRPEATLHSAVLRSPVRDDGWRPRKDGSRFWAEVVIATITDAAGALLGYAVIARDGTTRKRAQQAVSDAYDRMRALAARLEQVAEQEKMRLSREIHDVLGQELTGLKLDLSWLGRRITRISDPIREPLLKRLGTMASQIDDCVQTVRRIATGLRPILLDDLGLGAAIEWQAHEFQLRAGIRMELSLPENDLSLDRDRATAIFRIFQELITNVARHAGATEVSVQLGPEMSADGTLGAVVLEVSDNGRGITPTELARQDALGLLGMRERAAQFGGSLTITGAEGQGTRALVRIPV